MSKYTTAGQIISPLDLCLHVPSSVGMPYSFALSFDRALRNGRVCEMLIYWSQKIVDHGFSWSDFI